MSKVGYKDLVKAAETRVRTVSAEEAIDERGADDVVFVDLRDVTELKREAWKSLGGEVTPGRK